MNSRIQPGIWVRRLVGCLEDLGIESGWLFQKSNGDQRTVSSFADEFYAHLLTIQEEDPSLFEPDMDLLNDYGLARSCQRRGATTRAWEPNLLTTNQIKLANKVSADYLIIERKMIAIVDELMHRWIVKWNYKEVFMSHDTGKR
jgi:hypothetical protein